VILTDFLQKMVLKVIGEHVQPEELSPKLKKESALREPNHFWTWSQSYDHELQGHRCKNLQRRE
jgi:hypothetical protein